MTTANVIREFYAIRYSHADFGARPDQTHSEMVAHPLSDGRFVVVECETMTAAYIAAHAAIGAVMQEGPMKGRSIVGSGVEVIRAVEHDPVTLGAGAGAGAGDPFFGMFARVVTMTITASDSIPGIPHFASGRLSNYHPVNGVVTPKTITIED